MTGRLHPPAVADRLAPILAAKRAEVAARAARGALEGALEDRPASPPRGFARALLEARAAGRFGLIAEIKKASPSQGLIRADFRPATLARAYAEGGAACLSVLTEADHFAGADAHLIEARAACALPVLRKDFIVDPRQIPESRRLGADCILLIVAALTDSELTDCAAAARAVGLDVLIEVHNEAELDRALALDIPLIGINNRNLRTMEVDLATAIRLAARVPADRLVVAESGIRSHADILRLSEHGITTFLVGESLMRAADVAAATRRLLSGGSAG